MHIGSVREVRKVFIVSEYVCPEQNSTGYFWSKLIKKTGECFSDVFVVTPWSENLRGEENKTHVKYLNFGARGYDKNTLISRLAGQARQCLGFIKYIVKDVRRNDVVLTGTNPALLLILIPVLKFFLRFRWCLLVHDVFPENLVPARILRNGSVCYRVARKVFDLVYSQADHVIVIGRDMGEIISRKTDRENNISVIQNWVSDADIVPLDRVNSKIINELEWQDRIVFQFFGNMGRVQGIDNILSAISLVRNSKASFLFIGDGVEAKVVRKFVGDYAGDNVAYIGSIDQSEKNVGLAACDVALITLSSGMLGLGVPSKAYFSMAADKPLLAVMDASAEVALMVQEDNVGWVCAPSDPAALALLIDNICDQKINIKKGHVRNILQNKYSEEVALEKFIICLRSVATQA